MLHYHFESGPTKHYRKELRRLWGKYYVFDSSRVKDVHLNGGLRTHSSLEHRLVKKKPAQNLIVN
jgi:hypothetical protein